MVRRFMKRKKVQAYIMLVFFICVIGWGIVACKKEAVEVIPEKKKLILWHYWDLPYARQTLEKMIDGFNHENPDLEIRLKYVPDEDFKKQLSLAMADGSMPDIVLMDSSDVQFFNETGYLVDVTDIVDKEAYLDVAIASCLTKDGRLSGIPLGVNCLAFYYNKDILEAAGVKPPETLDEFLQVATQVSQGDVYGCAFPSLQSEESLFCFLPILWAQGGDIDQINSDNSKQAFELLRQLSLCGAMSPSVVNMTLGDVAREFKKGKIAMMFTTTMSIKSIQEDHSDFDFEVRKLPVAPEQISVVGGEVLAVIKGDYQEDAKHFLHYMANPERIKHYIDCMGYMSPRQDVLDWQIQENPEILQQVEILKTARTRAFSPDWPKISLAMADAINDVILGANTEETLDQLAERIRKIREGEE